MDLQEGAEEIKDNKDPLKTQEETKIEEYLKLEGKLRAKRQEEIDLISKANMEWELHILHNANMNFFKYGDSYTYYHLLTLPLPLLKLESKALAYNLRPNVLNDELGGWEEVDIHE